MYISQEQNKKNLQYILYNSILNRMFLGYID
ncbi:hypothetical protein Alsa3_CDS0117 [Staphylococcus phage Alsa_3]|nr:hypothetical protein Alsa3_CDS0117 [Staphylococcus phage Alsa_3]WNM51243.1 hypothetical protein Alsa4_CDS0113 [Staphylococcus phage Alsa_4]